MENGNLTYRDMTKEDMPFFQKLVIDNPTWAHEELSNKSIEEFFEEYKDLNGNWLVWHKDLEKVAVSFHVEEAPSNQKPWIGTVLVRKSSQNQNIGRRILDRISAKMKILGKKVMFAGVPGERYEWMDFLSKCSFEQYKLEKDQAERPFVIMLRPL